MIWLWFVFISQNMYATYMLDNKKPIITLVFNDGGDDDVDGNDAYDGQGGEKQ
jgi:hypothetical protein